MYLEGNPQYKYHVAKYGHPSKFGFKDVIATFQAERWRPQRDRGPEWLKEQIGPGTGRRARGL